jgi:hypothetical protein
MCKPKFQANAISGMELCVGSLPVPCRESCSWSFSLHKTICFWTVLFFGVRANLRFYKNCHLNHFHDLANRYEHSAWRTPTEEMVVAFRVQASERRVIQWNDRGGDDKEGCNRGKFEWMRCITRRRVREAGLTVRGSGLAESWLTVSGIGCDGEDTEWELWLRDCFIIKMVHR